MISLEPPRGVAAEPDPWGALGLNRAGLTRFLQTAQQTAQLSGTVEVLLSDDRALRRLNRQFRGKNRATDVLSFPAPVEVAGQHAGDLAISLETAARQAAEHGLRLRDEVRILLLHGLLHLSGMDHEIDDGEMREQEAALRRRLRLPVGLIARAQGEFVRSGPLDRSDKLTPAKLTSGRAALSEPGKTRMPKAAPGRKR